MKKVQKHLKNNSIMELMNHISVDMFTGETLMSIFRSFLETTIENRFSAIVLIKVQSLEKYQGLLNRLKYSSSKIFIYSDELNDNKYTTITDKSELAENDEFLIIVDDNFSATLYWDRSTIDRSGLCEGFCSLNPYEARQIIEHLQTIAYNEQLNQCMSELKADRRQNFVFTTILKKLASNLENNQRDLICANEQINEQSNNEAKFAEISQLCSTIAHELRNPLGMINLYAKIIVKNIEKLDNTQDSEIMDSLANATKVISNASENLEKILNDILYFSKPVNLEKRENNVIETLENIVNLAKPAFDEKLVNLSINYKKNKVINAKYDNVKISQAVLNVIKNALEVSKSGDTVTINVEQDFESKKILIKIIDQGNGIQSDDVDKIFTPYFTTKKDGSGLGLAFSKKIMEAHNENLVIISTGSEGTTFGLSLISG